MDAEGVVFVILTSAARKDLFRRAAEGSSFRFFFHTHFVGRSVASAERGSAFSLASALDLWSLLLATRVLKNDNLTLSLTYVFNIFYLMASFCRKQPLGKWCEERLDSMRWAVSDGISRKSDFLTH